MANTGQRYKLHYFNVRGRAEAIRYILHYAGIEFEDYRFSIPEWIERNPRIPFHLYEAGKVPMLEITENGETWHLTQSLSICNYLARRYNLAGSNEKEAAQCDEIADSLQEPLNLAVPAYYNPDEQFKATTHEKLKTLEYPRVLGFLEKKLKANGGKHMVGQQITWADFAVCWVIRALQDYAKPISAEIDEKYPALVELTRSVEQIPSIAAYIAKRPESDR